MASTRLLLEGSDIESLLAQVRDQYGDAARIISADKVRSGGIGGFFAKERYELAIEIEDAAAPSAGWPQLPTPAHERAAAAIDSVQALLDLADRQETALSTPAAAPVASPYDAIRAVESAAAHAPRPPEPMPAPRAIAAPAPAAVPPAAVPGAVPAAAVPAAAAAPVQAAVAEHLLPSTSGAEFAEILSGLRHNAGAPPPVTQPVTPSVRPLRPAPQAGAAHPAVRNAYSELLTSSPSDDAFPAAAAVLGENLSAESFTPLGSAAGMPGVGLAAPHVGQGAEQGAGRHAAAEAAGGLAAPSWTTVPPPAWTEAALPGSAASPPAESGWAPHATDEPAWGARAGAAYPPAPADASVTASGAGPVPAPVPGPVAAPGAGPVPAPVDRPVTPPQPAADQRTSPLADALVGLGLPAHLAERAIGRDPYSGVVRALGMLPAPPAAPAGPGEIVVIVGELTAAMAVARQAAKRMRIDPAQILVAGPTVAGTGLHASRRLTGTADAQKRAVRLHAADVPHLVVVDAPLDGDHSRWVRTIVESLRAAAVWAVVDATRKTADVARQLGGFGLVDALAVHGVSATGDPASVLHLGIPVASLDGRRATPQAWAALLCDRLEHPED